MQPNTLDSIGGFMYPNHSLFFYHKIVLLIVALATLLDIEITQDWKKDLKFWCWFSIFQIPEYLGIIHDSYILPTLWNCTFNLRVSFIGFNHKALYLKWVVLCLAWNAQNGELNGLSNLVKGCQLLEMVSIHKAMEHMNTNERVFPVDPPSFLHWWCTGGGWCW